MAIVSTQSIIPNDCIVEIPFRIFVLYLKTTLPQSCDIAGAFDSVRMRGQAIEEHHIPRLLCALKSRADRSLPPPLRALSVWFRTHARTYEVVTASTELAECNASPDTIYVLTCAA